MQLNNNTQINQKYLKKSKYNYKWNILELNYFGAHEVFF